MAISGPALSKPAKIIVGVVLALVILGGGGGYGGYLFVKSSAENDTKALIDRELQKFANQVEVTYRSVAVDIFDETATVRGIMVRDKILGGPPLMIDHVHLSGLRDGQYGIEALTMQIRGLEIPVLDAMKMATEKQAKEGGTIGMQEQTEAAAFIGLGYQTLVGDADIKVDYQPDNQTSQVAMTINFRGLGGWGMSMTMGGITPELAKVVYDYNDRMAKLENPTKEQGPLMLEMAGKVLPLVRGLELHKAGFSLRDDGLGDRLVRAALESEYEIVAPEEARAEAAKTFLSGAKQSIMAQGLPDTFVTRFVKPFADMVENGGKIAVQTSMADPLKLFSDEPGPFGIMPNPALMDANMALETLNLQVSR